jgi:hypothetical protein
MRLVALVVISVLIYAAAMMLMDSVLGIDPESMWYWLPFGVSLSVLGIGLFIGFRKWSNDPAFATISATIIVSAGLVFVADLAVALLYSCAKGVCL